MKWFEHHTDDRDKAHSKIIRANFGAEGYGIYMMLLEVIGQNVLETNQDEWGCVAEIHDISSLAKECSVSPQKLRRFLEFCNKKNIFLKKSEKLYTDLMLKRLDIYAKRIKSKSKKFEVSSKSVRSNVEVSSTLHTHTQTHSNLSNDKLEQAPAKTISKPQEDKRNVLVQHTLEEFKRVFGFYPTDRKPRWVAQHLIQRLKTVTANRLGGELTQERLKKGITKYFNWLADQEGFTGIQKLETAKLKINIFIETIPVRKEQDAIS